MEDSGSEYPELGTAARPNQAMRNQSEATEKQLFPIASGLPRRPSDADGAKSVKKGALFALKDEFSQAAEDDESPAA